MNKVVILFISVFALSPFTKCSSISGQNRKDIIETRISNDTLQIITTDPFLYYPFGIFRNVNQYEKRYPLLKRVPVTSKKGNNNLFKYKYKNSTTVIFMDKNDSKRIQIVNAMIKDNIKIVRDISIGMDKLTLLSLLGYSDCKDKLKNINVVECISGLDGVWLYFMFKENLLESILIRTDYTFAY